MCKAYFYLTDKDRWLSEGKEAYPSPRSLRGGQTMVDQLKELNLKTKEESRLTYMSTMLTPKKEEYFKIPFEYKDMFAWKCVD